MTDFRIKRDYRVRFSQIDGAHVIYYPRYFEILALAFPELGFGPAPFELKTKFIASNRLGDDISLELVGRGGSWTVTGHMETPRFEVAMRRVTSPPSQLIGEDGFAGPEFVLGEWACGPDGLLQVSRYYEIVSENIELWFESSLGMNFRELHIDKRFGIPTVSLKSTFENRPHVGEMLQMRLQLRAVGSSAVQFETQLQREEECLVSTRQVIVFVKLFKDRIEKKPIPKIIRQALEAQLATAEDG